MQYQCNSLSASAKAELGELIWITIYLPNFSFTLLIIIVNVYYMIILKYSAYQ